jgi:hypothetical protein
LLAFLAFRIVIAQVSAIPYVESKKHNGRDHENETWRRQTHNGKSLIEIEWIQAV